MHRDRRARAVDHGRRVGGAALKPRRRRAGEAVCSGRCLTHDAVGNFCGNGLPRRREGRAIVKWVVTSRAREAAQLSWRIQCGNGLWWNLDEQSATGEGIAVEVTYSHLAKIFLPFV